MPRLKYPIYPPPSRAEVLKWLQQTYDYPGIIPTLRPIVKLAIEIVTEAGE